MFPSGETIILPAPYTNVASSAIQKCFKPIPDVDSTVLFFSKKENPLIEYNEINEFIIFKRKLFSHKRKSLNYVLKKFNLSDLDTDMSKRVEDLNLSLLIEIFRKINF